jgi:hypothetical protein
VQIQEAQPGQGAEALHPLRFLLRFDNRALVDSYFVNNVLVYEWEFEFTPDKPVRRMSRIDSPVRVNQPRVTMYVPAAGMPVVLVAPFTAERTDPAARCRSRPTGWLQAARRCSFGCASSLPKCCAGSKRCPRDAPSSPMRPPTSHDWRRRASARRSPSRTRRDPAAGPGRAVLDAMPS